MIFEPIFEPRFSSKSHAFRPGRNPHTVIRTIRSNFAGYLWFLKGDISEVFDNVDIDVVMASLQKAIKDKKVLNLIKSGLKAPAKSRGEEEDEMDSRKRKKGQTKKEDFK